MVTESVALMEIESLRGDLLTEKISGLNMPKTRKTINAALNVMAEVTDSNPPTGLISIPIMSTCLRASHMHQLKTHVRQHVTWGKKHRIGTVA